MTACLHPFLSSTGPHLLFTLPRHRPPSFSQSSSQPGAAAAPALEGATPRKRKRGEDSAPKKSAAAAAVTPAPPQQQQQQQQQQLVAVAPFLSLEAVTSATDALADWLQDISDRAALWVERARAVLRTGGEMAGDLPDLVAEGQQFLWGGRELGAARALYPSILAAAQYAEAVGAVLRGNPKTTLEAAEELLVREPKPLPCMPGLDKLAEAVEAGRAWLERATPVMHEDAAPVELRVLDALCGEAGRLAVAVPEARALRERLNAAQKVGEAIRKALPSAREAGRRKKDESQVRGCEGV